MTDTKKVGSTVPAQSTGTGMSTKEKLDKTTVKVLEHLTALQDAGDIKLPKDYVPGNALKVAGLMLTELKNKDGKAAMEVCTLESIANSLLMMTMQGLSVGKGQGYLIVYGDKLQFQRDYRGSILLAKRDADVKEVNANVIYQGDQFTYEVDTKTGRMEVVEHKPSLEHQDITKIKGAYAIVVFNDGSTALTVMTIEQIKKAWMQGFGGGNTKAHQNFTDEMAKKTVINRACKVLIGSSDDSEIVDEEDQQTKARNATIKEKAGSKELNIQDTTFEEVKDNRPASTSNTKAADTATISETKVQDNVQAFEAAGSTTQEDGPGY